MAEYEDYPQEYIKRTSICGAVLSESNLDTGRKTPGQPKEKDPHGVSYKEKQSDQATTTWSQLQREAKRSGHDQGPKREHRRGRGFHTGTDILPRESMV